MFLVAALSVVFLPYAAQAEDAIAATATSIDASTIRVFAVGTVGIEQVEVPGNRSVAVADATAGHGTGFVLDDGLVMTAQHVVEGARHVVVRLPGDGGFFPARVVYADKDKDVAVLAVDGVLPRALSISAEPPRVRSTVFAVGYPLDATRKQPQSARGIIAGYLDDGTVQLDMALNPGNSGGPIVNDQDTVVGMAIARGAVEQGVQGVGYAVPVQMLRAAHDEAKRRLGTGESAGASGMSRDSAMVVDELVQHGAFYELRKKTDLAAAPAAELDKALADVLARIQDPDLLVFVASAMWNTSLALEYVNPTTFKLTPDQAQVLRTRLRESARGAVHRAVQLDRSVGTRSAFVGLVTAESDNVAAPGMAVSTLPPLASTLPRTTILIQGAPIVRYNESTGSTGLGLGASFALTFGRPTQDVVPLFGIAYGSASVSTADGEFEYHLFAAQLGILARFDQVYVAGMLEGCVYTASTASTMDSYASASDAAVAGRIAVGYRIGKLEIGFAARMLGGPTLWIEPVYAGLAL